MFPIKNYIFKTNTKYKSLNIHLKCYNISFTCTSIIYKHRRVFNILTQDIIV